MLRNTLRWIALVIIALLLIGAAILLIAGLPKPSTIRAEGVGRVPLKPVVDTVGVARRIRAAGTFAAWHSSERRVFTTQLAGFRPQLHLLTDPHGKAEQLTSVSENWTLAAIPPGPADYVVLQMDTGGDESHQLYRLRLSDRSLAPITHGRAQNLAGRFQRHGRLLAFTSTLRNGKDRDICVIDPEKPDTRRIVAQMEGWCRLWDWAPDDSRMLVTKVISSEETRIYTVDMETGAMTPLLPESAPRADYLEPQWGPDGRSVYFISNAHSEFSNVRVITPANGEVRVLSEVDDHDVEHLRVSPDGRTLVAVVNEDGARRPYRIDAETGEAQALTNVPSGTVENLSFHPRRPEIAWTHIGSSQTAVSVYSMDLAKLELTAWTSPPDPGELAPAKKVLYPTFDQVDGKSRMIPAWLMEPPADRKRPWPVLIEIHGGPQGQSLPTISPRDGFLLRRGVAVLKPNVRGSTGYGRAYLSLDNGYLREDSVKDIGALLDWIRTQPALDAKRIAVLGGSYGGYMSLAAATHYSDRLRCAVDLFGITDFVSFLERTADYMRDPLRMEFGDEREPKMRAFLESISPIRHVHRIGVPVLIYQGAKDPRVPLNESRQMVETLRKRGGAVRYVEAEDEGHGMTRPQNMFYTEAAISKFVETYLLKP